MFQNSNDLKNDDVGMWNVSNTGFYQFHVSPAKSEKSTATFKQTKAKTMKLSC